MNGIVFTTEEVHAALAGTLTEIRRAMTPAPRPGRNGDGSLCYGGGNTQGGIGNVYHVWEARPGVVIPLTLECQSRWEECCPLGVSGDLIRVKERWARVGGGEGEPERVVYAADGEELYADWTSMEGVRFRWRSPVTMPLVASRLLYTNRGVRVEQADGVWTWIVTVERVNRPDGSPLRPVEIWGPP